MIEMSSYRILNLNREWTPFIDLYENDTNFFLVLELAGLDKEDIKITIEDEQIVKVRGERRSLEREAKINYYKVEIRSGEFARNIPLPQKVDVHNIRIERRNGMFKLILKKKLKRKIRIIEKI